MAWLAREAGPWLRSIHREQLCNPRNGYNGSLAALEDEFRSHGLLDTGRVAAMLTAPPEVTRLHHARYEDERRKDGTIGWFCQVAGLRAERLQGIDPLAANLSFSDAQAAQIVALKGDASLTAGQRDEAFRVISQGGQPDTAAIRRRFPAPAPCRTA